MTELTRGVLLEMQNILNLCLKFLKSHAGKKYRVSTGLCKKVFIILSIVFPNENNKTNLVPCVLWNFYEKSLQIFKKLKNKNL